MQQERIRESGGSGEESEIGTENSSPSSYFQADYSKGKGGVRKCRTALEVEVTTGPRKKLVGSNQGCREDEGSKDQKKRVRPPVVGRAAGVAGAERDSEEEISVQLPPTDHSPSSSVASLRPLEWDSGADVGYYCYPSGSGEVGARCDPEGTTGLLVPGGPPPPIVPVAESTPKDQHHPLFPEVIVQRRGGNAPTPPPPPPLPPSHSTSSVTTVVTNSELLTNQEGAQESSFEWAAGSVSGDINVEAEIERGATLLARLVDGKDPQARHALVKQVVKRILDYQSPTADKCIGTGESVIDTSDWTSPRPSSSLPSTFSGRRSGGDISGESTRGGKEWKKPVTKSEKLYSHHNNKVHTSSDSGVDDKKLMEYLQSEKKSQLEWIKSEISHLSSLQALLERHETLKRNLNKLKKQNSDTFRRRQGKSALSSAIPKPKNTLASSNIPPPSTTPSSPDGESSGWSSHRYFEENDVGGCGRGGSRAAAVQTSPMPYAYSFNTSHSKESSRRMVSLDELHAALDQILGVAPGPTLQDHLMEKRPDLVKKVEERRKIVSDITAMREARSRKKRQIIVAASASGVNPSEIPLPLPPLAVKRVVSQREMKRSAEARWRRQEEVRAKQADTKRKQEYRTNRLMAEIFNKKLQAKVLKGQVNLSNSLSVISNF